MYGFRKPFAAATFADVEAAGIDFKTVLVVAQVAGYMVAKFLGIKIIAEMPPERRAGGLLVVIAVAELALVLFAMVPPPWNAACMFLNGMALGMVFGLVLGFLEGRQNTEALAAGLCASFIVADGVVKSLGAWLLKLGVSEMWMPAVAGLLFVAPIGVGAWMLSRIPPPSAGDIAARAERARLFRSDRWSLFGRYAGGLCLLITMFLAITVARSMRADFAPEIWRGLGHSTPPAVFATSELWVAFGILAINGAAVLIRDNRHAFFAALATCAAGCLLAGTAIAGWQQQWLDPFGLMVLLGLGLYLPYVAIHTTIFERLLAMTRDRGNIGFLMYVADSISYLGYMAVMLGREFLKTRGELVRLESAANEFVQFFLVVCWITCGVSLVCIALAWRYFAARQAPAE
jgi:Family of unknown function (DUF5690)